MSAFASVSNGLQTTSHIPFWQPFGGWGCLWRTILFLLGLALICFLLALLLRGCQSPADRNNPTDPSQPTIDWNDPDSVAIDEDPYRDLPPELRDTSLVGDWNDSIPGVAELPDPEDNFIQPIDSSRIITDPEDSLVQIVADELLVIFNSSNIKDDMAKFARRFKELYPGQPYRVQYYNPQTGVMSIIVDQKRRQEIMEQLPRQIPDIEFVVINNEILRESAQPSDPGFQHASYDEYYRLIQAYEAWDITRGDSSIKVAIVDSYFDLTNPEIGERYVDRIHIPTKSKNVLPPSRNPSCDADLTSYCHGSHVAGLAIGAQNNSLGCSGIAPKCSWIPVSLGDQLTNLNILEGVLYAIYHGADVVNFSIGRNFPPGTNQLPLQDQVGIATQTDRRGEALWEFIVKAANDHKCVLVTSAGNETLLSGMDPKNRSKYLIKVEAVDNQGQMAPFSNWGRVPDANLDYSTIAAPGVNLWSVTEKRCAAIIERAIQQQGLQLRASAKDGFQEMSGTSMAAPIVAGAVALLKSKNKNLTTEQVIKILQMTGKQTDTQHPIGPTIQIRDALDATGGDLLNFDDLMKNHDLLLGKWRSTHELQIANPQGQKVDDIWSYFIFTSTTSGTLEMHTINLKRVYRAPLQVVWGNNQVTFIQQSDAVDASGDRVNKDDYICTPDQSRLLKASCQRNGQERYNFMLEKVN